MWAVENAHVGAQQGKVHVTNEMYAWENLYKKGRMSDVLHNGT